MGTEKRTPITMEMVRLYCECGGEMAPTGRVLTSIPPQYPHQCPLCNAQAVKNRAYPYVDYVEAPQDLAQPIDYKTPIVLSPIPVKG